MSQIISFPIINSDLVRELIAVTKTDKTAWSVKRLCWVLSQVLLIRNMSNYLFPYNKLGFSRKEKGVPLQRQIRRYRMFCRRGEYVRVTLLKKTSIICTILAVREAGALSWMPGDLLHVSTWWEHVGAALIRKESDMKSVVSLYRPPCQL